VNSSSAPVSSSPAVGESSIDRKVRHRQAVLDEIVKTEQDYVSYIGLAIECFLKPAQQQNLIAQPKLNQIFSNIEVLHGVNSQLSQSLQKAQADGFQQSTISDCFLALADCFRMYADYCSNQQHAAEVYKKVISKDDNFAAFCENARKSEPRLNSLGLEDLLIQPVQRICKYPLLFRELKKNTPKDHPEYEQVERVEAKLEEVATHVNERKRLAENHNKIVKIQSQLEGLMKFELVAPQRRFIHKGVVSLNAKDSQRMLFLFRDLLVIAKKKAWCPCAQKV